MLSVAATLHLLGTIVWVGGMFFAHMALRPAATELLEPSLRLPLLKRTLDHFFVWVKTAIVLILVTGYWIFLVAYQGQMGLYVHIMQGTGLLMVGLFLFIYFFPYKRMGIALDKGDIPLAGAQMAVIRRVIGINLALGMATSVIAVLKPF